LFAFVLTEMLCRNLLGGTEENHETLQSGNRCPDQYSKLGLTNAGEPGQLSRYSSGQRAGWPEFDSHQVQVSTLRHNVQTRSGVRLSSRVARQGREDGHSLQSNA
jgi:hypothetical protein